MQFSPLSRSELLSVLTDSQKDFGIRSLLRFGEPSFSPEPKTMWACWEDDESGTETLPNLLVLPESEMADFFAWAITFIPNLRPFTAFIRVLPWNQYELAQQSSQNTDKRNIPVLVGATLGEVLMDAANATSLDSLPFTAFESTYSMTLARAVCSGFNVDLIKQVNLEWSNVRRITEQPVRRSIPNLLDSVWAVVLRLINPFGWNTSLSPQLETILESCSSIINSGHIPRYSWNTLLQGQSNTIEQSDILKASREHRVEIFEQVAQSLIANRAEELTGSFIVGYLASLIGSGSIEHFHLLLPLQSQFPTAMIWYGICVALDPRSQILKDNGSLGLKLARTVMTRDKILAAPKCDISAGELEILLRASTRVRNIRRANSSVLRVEVGPTITTTVKWPHKAIINDQIELAGLDLVHGAEESDRIFELMATLQNGLLIAQSMLSSRGAKPKHNTTQRRGKKRNQ